MIQLILLLVACSSDEPVAPTGDSSAQDSAIPCDDPQGSGDSADSADSEDSGEAAPRALDLYILAGQSNMDGYAFATGLPPSLAVGQADVALYWSGNAAWTALQPASYAVLYGWDCFGPEVSFGRFMADLDPDQPVALIKHAVGGTGLYDYWYPGTSREDPGQGVGYHDLIATFDAATDALDAEGVAWRVAGMLWMQGESDALADASIAGAYEANLTRLITRARADFEAPDLPFVIGKIYCPTCTYGDVVRTAEDAVAAADEAVFAFDTDDLPINNDNIHYDAPGQRALGERFAQAMLGLPLSPSARPAFVLSGAFSSDYSGDFFLGYQFTLDRDITLTDLGTLDYGLDGLIEPSQVAVWEADTGTLVARASLLPATSALSTPWSAWRFVAIEPVNLDAGAYVIGSQVYSASTDRYIHDADVLAADGVNWDHSRYNNGVAVAQPRTSYDNPASWFGPNFLFIER